MIDGPIPSFRTTWRCRRGGIELVTTLLDTAGPDRLRVILYTPTL